MSEVGTRTRGEDRSHRDHILNPRRWPHGQNVVPHPRMDLSDFAEISLEERDLLYHLTFTAIHGDLANLGHAGGASAITMARAILDRGFGRSSVVESVDLFTSAAHWGGSRRRLVLYGVRQIVNPCRGYTKEWGEKFTAEGRRFAGLFIDADHTYVSVVEDSNLWRPLCHPGGWVAFHDTHQDFSHKAIEETIEKDTSFKEAKELHVDSIRVFRRAV